MIYFAYTICLLPTEIRLPCSRDQACLYVTALANNLSFQSILTYYQAVVYVHVCNSLDPIRLSDPILKSTLAGIERSKANHKVGKDPMLPIHLVKIATVIDLHDDLELFLAMLLMFRTLLRVSHVVKGGLSQRRQRVSRRCNAIFVTGPIGAWENVLRVNLHSPHNVVKLTTAYFMLVTHL